MLNATIQRIATALVLAPLFIWAIFKMPSAYFEFLLLAFIALGAWEFSRLIQFEQVFSRVFFTIGVIGSALLANHHTENLTTLLYITVAWWGINLYWVLSYPNNVGVWFGSSIIRVMSGVLLLVPTWVALIHLRATSAEVFLLLMLIIWGADSGAYFVGRAFGKHKLAPKVSPGKSIEGVVGGIGSALIVTLIFLQIQNTPADKYLGFLLLSVIVACVSVLGDLFESLFKRESGMKDSGQILPGHGGVLDRIDSLTAAAPFFLLGLSLL